MHHIEDWAKKLYTPLASLLDERAKRLVVAAEAEAIGRGGITRMSKISGMSRVTIHAGIKELEGEPEPTTSTRRPGGGRKKLVSQNPEISRILKEIVESTTCGDPESPLLWTCKSLRNITKELAARGYKICCESAACLLDDLGYSLQGNRKVLAGSKHPDRNAQFEFISAKVKEAIKLNNPVISVDTKKKELIGQYKNPGQTWRLAGNPEKVKDHDFPGKLGRANPYGVYDLGSNTGWVSVGTDHDTASFAVETIRRWWNVMGKTRYPNPTALMITADGGGSNGTRVRLWKKELQNLANDLGFPIQVSHLPPGTSKWNKIEHRMFCHISMNWRGQPLTSHEVMVELISHTKTKSGLEIKSEIDTGTYPLKVKVKNDEFNAINIKREEFHGEWNYVISPITT